MAGRSFKCSLCAPDVYGGVGLLAFILVIAVLDSLRSSPLFDTSACSWDAASHRQTAFFTTGISVGCLSVLMVLLVVRTSLRNSRPMRSALIVLGTTVIHFAFAASEQPPVVCVRPLGGASPAARPQQPLEYAYWIAVVVHEQLALAFLAKRPSHEGIVSGCVLNVLLAAGSAASFTESLIPWATLLCIASISHFIATTYLTRTFRAAYINATDSPTRRLTAVFGSVAFALWNTYPLVWLAAQYSAITPETEACVWLILDTTTKISVSFIMVFGSYREDTRAADAALQVLDAQRKSAEARDSAKRVFMRYILHELRVPLQGSQLAIEEIQHGFQTGELVIRPHVTSETVTSCSTGSCAPAASLSSLTEAADTAAAGMLALGKILDDFLSLAKIEDGRMELELVDVNIAAWLQELTTIFAFALRSKRLQLHVLVDPSMPRSIYVDGNRLRQVVSNYLSNAIKFSSADGVVTVELLVVCRELSIIDAPEMSARTDAGLGAYTASTPSVFPVRDRVLRPFLRISVADRGPGIAHSELPLLFQPFIQLRAGELQKGMGTGLGLALCKSIVGLMKGDVGAASEVGRGSSFWMEIPLTRSAEQPQPESRYADGISADGQVSDYRVTESLLTDVHQGSALHLGRVLPITILPPAYDNVIIIGVAQQEAMPPIHYVIDVSQMQSGSVVGASPAAVSTLRALPGGVATSGLVPPPAEVAVQHLQTLQTVGRAVVVDDVLTNRELFARLLRRAGAHVEYTAVHGLDCLTQLRELLRLAHDTVPSSIAAILPRDERVGFGVAHELAGADALVDLWFIDGNMPVMDGLELARQLRDGGVRGLIVAVTGNALMEDQAAFLAAGADAVLTKPCSTAMVHGALATLGYRLPLGPTS